MPPRFSEDARFEEPADTTEPVELAPAPPPSGPSAVEPDWARERVTPMAWQPAPRLLQAIRAYQHWKSRGWWAKPLAKWAVVRVRFWNVVCGSEIHCNTRFGGGLMLPHPTGVVIHPRSRIGVNCMIFQGVTLGAVGPDGRVPTVGGHVDIGSGAKVLGGVTIGDHAKIGANAVVLCDVPAGATAVGAPARIIPAPTARLRTEAPAMPDARHAALAGMGILWT